MATIEEFTKMSRAERQLRYFSDEFKRKKVSEIERNLVTVAEISREYNLTRAAIYKWIYKYSRMKKKKERQVIESQSDTIKIKQLKEKIKELEQLVGQKQIKIEFMEKMIEIAEDELGVDIKKNSSSKPLFGSGKTESNTKEK